MSMKKLKIDPSKSELLRPMSAAIASRVLASRISARIGSSGLTPSTSMRAELGLPGVPLRAREPRTGGGGDHADREDRGDCDPSIPFAVHHGLSIDPVLPSHFGVLGRARVDARAYQGRSRIRDGADQR